MSITQEYNLPAGPSVNAEDVRIISKLLRTDLELGDKGGTSSAERMMVFSLIRMLAPTSVLEVGVSGGFLTCWIAAALERGRKGKLTSVDNWSGVGGIAKTDAVAAARLEKHGLRHRVEFVTADSHKYLPNLPADSYDVVIIDGDHTADGATADVREAMRIAANGVVLVHDTWLSPVVRKACEDHGGFFADGHCGYWLWNARQKEKE